MVLRYSSYDSRRCDPSRDSKRFRCFQTYVKYFSNLSFALPIVVRFKCFIPIAVRRNYARMQSACFEVVRWWSSLARVYLAGPSLLCHYAVRPRLEIFVATRPPAATSESRYSMKYRYCHQSCSSSHRNNDAAINSHRQKSFQTSFE